MNSSGTDAGDATRTTPAYSERLSVPVTWWLVLAFLLVSFWFAFVIAIPPPWGHLPGVVAVLLAVPALARFGGLRIMVTPDALMVGRDRLPIAAIDTVRALPTTHARVIRGAGADASARFFLRPYLDRGVRVDLADTRHTAPYWYVATRDPERLADALERAGARKADPLGGSDA